MSNIDLTKSKAREACINNVVPESMDVTLNASGGGVTLEGAQKTDKRYIVGFIEVLADHSVAMMLRFFLPGAVKERIYVRFGLLPGVRTKVCFDLKWLDSGTIFTNRTPGTLKLVIHGLRTDINAVDRVELGLADCVSDINVRFEDFYLTDTKPEDFPLPDMKLVDEFGQWKSKEWPGKVHSFDQMQKAMQENEGPGKYPFPEWNNWGGDSTRKLTDGTGFFSTHKSADGRWHLVDPDGYEYFSLGPCCTRPGEMGRVDNFEKFCDWLPDVDDPEYGDFYDMGVFRRTAYMEPEDIKMFAFARANLYKVYGKAWKDKWEELTVNILKKYGCNSLGNFSNLNHNDGKAKIPYVCEIMAFPEKESRFIRDRTGGFPETDILIFRDFPDVLSPEYHEKSDLFAKRLEKWKDDPWLIGYFLRNEPEFNFVPDLAIANEVLHNPARTYCRAGLIGFLRGRYGTIEKLNAAWKSGFDSFYDFDEPIDNCIDTYPASEIDLREYSAFLIREYIRVPALACRKVDPNHLNLGLRWSEANNPDMMVGWEYFDVFSINCYSFDPTRDMDFVKDAGVDLPIMIGEYHCGALDRGIPATGLKGVENQYERGVMWRLFVEKCVAHPYGVGAHWFQYNDQFCLGRFDGENYQIGMVDVCMQPHKELVEAAKETSAVLYKVKNGEVEPFDTMPKSIPMIGY